MMLQLRIGEAFGNNNSRGSDLLRIATGMTVQ